MTAEAYAPPKVTNSNETLRLQEVPEEIQREIAGIAIADRQHNQEVSPELRTPDHPYIQLSDS